jgi:tRNA pseudouridine38-40 synthase
MDAYKILVAYDGLDYHGWQLQPDRLTIAGVLQSRFKAVFKKEIHIVGASRTDAGVHALGQVARFYTDMSITPEKLRTAWNNLLPRDILIRKLILAEPDFHPQRHVLEKTYYYHFFTQKPLPFLARYGFYRQMSLDLERLQECISIFVGTHDFRSFCTGYEQESTIRTINSLTARYVKRYGVYRIEIKGPGFLRYMIRRIVGASLDIASTSRPLKELREALAAKNPQQHLFTVPGHGLMLGHISYSR